MIKPILLYLSLIWGQSLFYSAHALEVDTNHRPISSKYYSGPYLIYNCNDQYWACVDDTGFEECTKDRYESIKLYFSVLACTPVEKFETMKDCFVTQQKLVDTPQNKDFCLHPLRRI